MPERKGGGAERDREGTQLETMRRRMRIASADKAPRRRGPTAAQRMGQDRVVQGPKMGDDAKRETCTCAIRRNGK